MDFVISRQRVIDHGEVYTPSSLVNDMLDLVAHECERIDSKFLEPACGNGNFLAEVLRRKLLTVQKENARNRLRWERDAIRAVCSIYGIDLLPDNVQVCRDRLYDLVTATHGKHFDKPLSGDASDTILFVLSRNIVHGDALTLLDATEKPIVFSEWAPVNGHLVKRKDYVYKHLLDHMDGASQPLFSELGEDVYFPKPVREFPTCHYLKLADAESAK